MTSPSLGAACRSLWSLDPDFLTVNHGSFGATPLAVLDEQRLWRERMEAQPSRFMSMVLPDALRAAAARLAAFIGAAGQDVVFVDNATGGCNAVLRSLQPQPDDAFLVLSHGYGAVLNTVRLLCRQTGARMIEARIPFPQPTPQAVLDAVDAALTPATRVAVIDHITSASALVLPVRQIVALCQARGVAVLVDGAHAPGQIDLDVPAIGADWYTGNCHKWLCAPKGAAFLWTAPRRQAETYPTIISHGLDQGYQAAFDWTGTRDPSAALSVPAALDFHAAMGGGALRRRNAALAEQAAVLVADRLGTETGAAPPMTAAMGLARLPVARAEGLRHRLFAAGTDAPVHAIGDSVWLRLSAFAYNDTNDYARLADIVARILREETA
jgi:isopenicillin-N epimerase